MSRFRTDGARLDLEFDKEITEDQIWRDEYKVDPEWRDLLLFKEGQLDTSTWDPSKRKRLLNKIGWFELIEGSLYYKHKVKPEDPENLLKVVPYKYRRQLLVRYHDMRLGGHRSAKAMMQVMMRPEDGIYWPGIKRDIQKYVGACRYCLLAKAPWRPRRGMIGDFGLDLGRFEHIHIDHVGPLGATEKGNQYILTMVDRATGWVELVAVPDKGMSSSVEAVFQRWICTKGVPLVVTGDNAFKAKLVDELGKRCGRMVNSFKW